MSLDTLRAYTDELNRQGHNDKWLNWQRAELASRERQRKVLQGAKLAGLRARQDETHAAFLAKIREKHAAFQDRREWSGRDSAELEQLAAAARDARVAAEQEEARQALHAAIEADADDYAKGMVD